MTRSARLSRNKDKRGDKRVQGRIESARAKGRYAVETAVDSLVAALEARPGDEIDHRMRVEAAVKILDRFGFPPRTEVDTVDAFAAVSVALKRAMEESAEKDS